MDPFDEILAAAPKPQTTSVVIGQHTHHFSGEHPGAVVGETMFDTVGIAGDVEHFSRILGCKIPIDIAQNARVIVRCHKGTRPIGDDESMPLTPSTADVARVLKIFVEDPKVYFAMATACKSVLPIDLSGKQAELDAKGKLPDEVPRVDPLLEVGLGNSEPVAGDTQP